MQRCMFGQGVLIDGGYCFVRPNPLAPQVYSFTMNSPIESMGDIHLYPDRLFQRLILALSPAIGFKVSNNPTHNDVPFSVSRRPGVSMQTLCVTHSHASISTGLIELRITTFPKQSTHLSILIMGQDLKMAW